MTNWIISIMILIVYAIIAASVAGFYDALYGNGCGSIAGLFWPFYLAYLSIQVIYVYVKSKTKNRLELAKKFREPSEPKGEYRIVAKKVDDKNDSKMR